MRKDIQVNVRFTANTKADLDLLAGMRGVGVPALVRDMVTQSISAARGGGKSPDVFASIMAAVDGGVDGTLGKYLLHRMVMEDLSILEMIAHLCFESASTHIIAMDKNIVTDEERQTVHNHVDPESPLKSHMQIDARLMKHMLDSMRDGRGDK